jgi:hypothetical protein
MKLLLISLTVLACSPVLFAQNMPQGRISDFLGFLKKVDAAQIELQNGRPEPFKALWSHSSEVTLSGGFGGTVEKVWDAVSKRLDWAGRQFSKGSNRIDRLVAMSDHKLAYVVQLEHIDFKAVETGSPSSRDYRVTMIFKMESEGWRIVHRHADSQMTKQAPK